MIGQSSEKRHSAITPQFSSWRMVPGIARLILVYYEIQSSLSRPVPLPQFEEALYFHVPGCSRSPQKSPAIYRLNHLRSTGTHSSTLISTDKLSCDTPDISLRLTLLHHSALRTILHGVLFPNPVIRRGDQPFDLPPPPAYLAHQTPPTRLFCFIPAPRLPTTQGSYTREGAAPGWFSFFKRLEDRVSSTQGTMPLSRVRESLESLNIRDFPDPVIDVPFASMIQTFRNLAHLNVMVNCRDGQCAFKLNNDDIAEFAMALPRLDSLLLGYPCDKNTCATTVACLLPISVRCPRLQSLGIHFNTTNIVDDLKNISGGPRFQELRSLRKCAISCLDFHPIPLTLDKSNPDLECCEGWNGVNWGLAEIRG